MRHPIAPIALLLLFAAVPGSAQERSFGRVTTVEMPRGKRAEGALLADLDGDGRRDLVIAAAKGGDGPGRSLRVHLRRDGEAVFGQVPDIDLALLEDVVGFAVADVHDDAGAEVVLFAPTGVFALRWRAEEAKDRYVKLFDADVLWQLPHHRKAPALQDVVRDVDGDGTADLVVPEPDGYRVALQRRGDGARTFECHSLRLPEIAGAVALGRGERRQSGMRTRRELSVSIQLGGEEAATDMLSVAESVPVPRLADWDGDGRADLLAQDTAHLYVWLQRDGFSAAPDVDVPLPLEVDRRRLLDVSYAALTSDLDGDRRADYVLVAGDQDADEPRAQVAVYTQAAVDDEEGAPLFGARGRPKQLLVIAGIAGSPELIDVDGDGRDDLVMGAVRFDALDALRAATGSTLDAELYVFLNRRGTFSRRPDLTGVVSISAKGLRRARRDTITQLLGDVTGDGVSELLLREDPARLRLLMVRRAGEGLSLIDRPLWETTIDEDADLVVTPRGDGPPEVVVVAAREILHVRFGR